MKEWDEKYISAFLNNYRVTDIMRETGLSKTTVYKLKNDPEFMEAVRRQKEEVLMAAVNKMTAALTGDVEALQAIIDDPETPRQVRINAITAKWKQYGEWIATTDIIRRLDKLENPSKGDSMTV